MNPKMDPRKPRPFEQGQLGVLNCSHVTCGLCGRVQELGLAQAHMARKYARYLGWTYIQTFGWACRCRHQYKGVVEVSTKMAKKRGRKSPELTRVQIELELE